MHYGAQQYQKASDANASPRSIELAVFRETNKRLNEASDESSRIKALSRNHHMWSTLLKDVGLSSNPLPTILKQDLTSIGLFAMRYSTLAITQSLSLDPLLEINSQMIDGLNTQAMSKTLLNPVVALHPMQRNLHEFSA